MIKKKFCAKGKYQRLIYNFGNGMNRLATVYHWCNMLRAIDHSTDSLQTFFHSVITAIPSENFGNSLDLSSNPYSYSYPK